jgi:hypothetical protein
MTEPETEIVYTIQTVPMRWPWRVRARLRGGYYRDQLYFWRRSWAIEPRPWRVRRRRQLRAAMRVLFRDVERAIDSYLLFGELP